MQLNKKMACILNGNTLEEFISDSKLAKRLFSIIDKGVIEICEAIVLRVAKKNAKNISIDYFPDLTGYECYLNHIHIEDYINSTRHNQDEVFHQGICFAISLRLMLTNECPSEKFNIILAQNKDGCSVRFHVVRSQESWLPNNLDVFLDEAILVINT